MKKIACIGLLYLFACHPSGQKDRQSESLIAENFLKEVVTEKAVMKQFQKELILTGKVTAEPDRTLSYSSLVSGVIVKTYFTLGDKVVKGQMMLDFRSAELSSLQSELVIAKRNLQSAETLFESGMVTERDVVEASSTYEKLHADLALYGESKGDGLFSIKTPMSGYVIEKYGNAGSPVSAESDPLFVIADLSSVWVIANIYAGHLQMVHEGLDVEITSVSYPKEVFKGKINSISQVFDPEDKALKARIIMPNTHLKLKPEMMVVVKLFGESTTEMVTVPSDAVIFDHNSYFVVVRSEDLTIRPIIPFDHLNGLTYVAEGLIPGEEVVTKNQLLIYNELKGK